MKMKLIQTYIIKYSKFEEFWFYIWIEFCLYKWNWESTSCFRYSDDSIVPEEMHSEAPNSDLGKDDCENFTMFLTDNLELFPDHILKNDYLDGSDLLLNESMEAEIMDTESINIEMSNVLNPIFGWAILYVIVIVGGNFSFILFQWEAVRFEFFNWYISFSFRF